MKLRIESDGIHSRVVNAETGEEIELVQSIVWEHHAGETPTAVIRVHIPQLQAAINSPEIKLTQDINDLWFANCSTKESD